jgi:hypothetical protein
MLAQMVTAMKTPLDRELAAYEQHRGELLAAAEGKYVLIHGDEVAGVYESQADAIAEGYRQFGNVPFLVKEVARIEVPQRIISGLLTP